MADSIASMLLNRVGDQHPGGAPLAGGGNPMGTSMVFSHLAVLDMSEGFDDD
jgi:hypothetical protein